MRKHKPNSNDNIQEISKSIDEAELIDIAMSETPQNESEDDTEKSDKKKGDSEKAEQSKESLSLLLKSNARLIFSTVPIAFIIALMFSLLTQTGLLHYSNSQLNGYQSQLVQLEDNYQNNMSLVNDKYTEEKIQKMLTANDIYIYTNSLWSYSLSANNEPFGDSMESTIPEISVPALSGKVTIILTETQEANPLPASIINIGRVTQGSDEDSLEKHILVEGYNESRIITTEGNTTNIEFNIENVESGDKIPIVISDQLAEKLNTPFTTITVTVE